MDKDQVAFEPTSLVTGTPQDDIARLDSLCMVFGIGLILFNPENDELPRRKQRGIKNFKFCHSALDAESSPVFWIPASAGMTNSPQAAGNTTRRD